MNMTIDMPIIHNGSNRTALNAKNNPLTAIPVAMTLPFVAPNTAAPMIMIIDMKMNSHPVLRATPYPSITPQMSLYNGNPDNFVGSDAAHQLTGDDGGLGTSVAEIARPVVPNTVAVVVEYPPPDSPQAV